MRCAIVTFALIVVMSEATGRDGIGQPGIRVIGAGLPNTGTQSMTSALTMLGYKSIHGMNLYFNMTIRRAWGDFLHRGGAFEPALQTLLDNGFDATNDVPMCKAYMELLERYPDAKVILTVRDNAQKWYDSFLGKGNPTALSLKTLLQRWHAFYLRLDFEDYVQTLIRNQRLYGCNFFTLQTPEIQSQCLAGYATHNEEVRKRVPFERLLIFNVKEGWGPLCAFLDLPVPEVPFPMRDLTKMTTTKDNAKAFFDVKTFRLLVEPGLVLLSLACLPLCLGLRWCCGRLRGRTANKTD